MRGMIVVIVPNQKVTARWNVNNKEWFISKGYNFTKINSQFEVKIDDLTPSSNIEVVISCDNETCQNKYYKKYNSVMKSERHYCSDECRNIEDKHTKQELINEFYRYFKEFGYYPQQNDMQVKRGFPSHYYYAKLWGSWDLFIREMDIKSGQGRWLKEDINTLKSMYENYPSEEIQSVLINNFSWGHIRQKAREIGLKRKFKEPSKRAYSKEYLISEFWRFYQEFGRYPFLKEISKTKGYPSESSYIRTWGSWSALLKELKLIEEDNTDGWYICDENILREKYYDCDKQEIIDSLIIKRNWGTVKKKANSMGLNRNMDKVNYSTKRMSEDFLKSELTRFYNEYGHTPTNEEFAKHKSFPSTKVYSKVFGTWNDALKSVGLELNAEFNVSKEEIIDRAIKFFNINNRSPYLNEIKLSKEIYNRYWLNYNDMLIEANLPINRETPKMHYKTNQELLDDYLELYRILGRIPIANDLNINDDTASFSTYKKRFGGYKEIWESCGISNEVILNESYYGFICLDKNGDICKSYGELVITNLFIENNINYQKELPYKKLIPNFDGKSYVLDWYLPDYNICVEFFGLYNKEHLSKKGKTGDYTRNAEKKKKIAIDNNVVLIDLYPEDLNETYLQRMVEKFKKFDIEIKVNIKNLYKNNRNKQVI